MLAGTHHDSHNDDWSDDGSAIRAAYLSTYPPRECGIATFCEDLVTSTLLGERAGRPLVAAMETAGHRRDYGWPVALVVDDVAEDEYEAAADYINESQAAVASVQHEFGIFGGLRGTGIFRFLDRIEKPVVSTLHTVLPEPAREVRAHVKRIADRSERLVVMNGFAVGMLERDYGIDRRKISLIHHGALQPSLETGEQAKARLRLSGRKVLSTFGLVARGKGLEYAISALPAIQKRHPEACYLIVGQTHPAVQRVEKESYREELAGLVEELGLQDSVRFVNRYVSKSEIIRYLAATDIYITPYLNPGQITSGTLAYAVAAGRAVVSTPYLYARFLLSGNRGVLVDFRSPDSIARAVNDILYYADLKLEFERRARICGQQMVWPAVGARYVQMFDEVIRESAPVAKPMHAQLQLTLQSPIEGNARHAIGRSRPASVAGSLAAADGLLRHRSAR